LGKQRPSEKQWKMLFKDHLRILKRRKLASLRGKINWEGDLNEMRTDKTK